MTIATDDDLNDLGNAERFAHQYAGMRAYAPELGVWREYRRPRWRDDDDAALRYAATIARSWLDDLAHEADSGRQKRLLQHAQRSCGANSLLAMARLARSLNMALPQAAWDADPCCSAWRTDCWTSRPGNPSCQNRAT